MSGLPGLARTSLWVLAVVIGTLATMVTASVAGSAAADLTGSGSAARLSLTFFVWTLLAGTIAAFVTRLLLVRKTSGKVLTALVLTIGALAAAVAQAALVSWTEAAYGRWDPEFVGLTGVLPFVMVVLTTSFVLAIQTTGRERALSLSLTVLLIIPIVVTALLNLQGLTDGPGAGAPMLLTMFAAAVVIVVSGLAGVWLRLRTEGTAS